MEFEQLSIDEYVCYREGFNQLELGGISFADEKTSCVMAVVDRTNTSVRLDCTGGCDCHSLVATQFTHDQYEQLKYFLGGTPLRRATIEELHNIFSGEDTEQFPNNGDYRYDPEAEIAKVLAILEEDSSISAKEV